MPVKGHNRPQDTILLLEEIGLYLLIASDSNLRQLDHRVRQKCARVWRFGGRKPGWEKPSPGQRLVPVCGGKPIDS